VIQKFVQDSLAEQLLEGNMHDGERMEMTASRNRLMFNGQAAKAPA
jgi:ATP-dependent Clp protease ATP-binding subunit ClpA